MLNNNKPLDEEIEVTQQVEQHSKSAINLNLGPQTIDGGFTMIQ
jgi:hypothetical protein